jgi:superfamily II DNA or RNA helicase
MAEVMAGARAKGHRTLLLVRRRELVHQASQKLKLAGVPHNVLAPGFKPAPEQLVLVASMQAIACRLVALNGFGLVVIDETHHVPARQWMALIAA